MSNYGQIVNSHTVRFERLLSGPIERVWDHITGPDGIALWLFADSSFQLRTGGLINLKFATPDPENGHEYRVRGTVSECAAPRLIAYSWIETSTDLTSSVRFEIETIGSEVKLIVTHSYVSPEFMPKVGAGWHAHLDILAAILRGEKPRAFLPEYTSLLVTYSATVAATLIVSGSVSPAIAQSSDPAFNALNAQRQQLLRTYDQAWK
jgi:uncharacterized protein YndB with AHSA1/START domain